MTKYVRLHLYQTRTFFFQTIQPFNRQNQYYSLSTINNHSIFKFLQLALNYLLQCCIAFVRFVYQNFFNPEQSHFFPFHLFTFVISLISCNGFCFFFFFGYILDRLGQLLNCLMECFTL